jgi:hypothetical protein
MVALAEGDASARRDAARGRPGRGRADQPRRSRAWRAPRRSLRLGRLEDAEAEVRATALEPLRASDWPETLVPRLARVQGLIAWGGGDRTLAARRLQEAADGWRRQLSRLSRGERMAAVLADLGRPVVGLDRAGAGARARAAASSTSCREPTKEPHMPSFHDSADAQAPPEEVWKLLYDPSRFPEWWAGIGTVEAGIGANGEYTMFPEGYPDFPMAQLLDTKRDGRAVTVSCLVSDLRFEWILEPLDGEHTRINVHVEIPEAEAGRLEDQKEVIRTSLGTLAELAARAV